MTELLTSAEMKAIETAAIGAGAVTGLDLMEIAGGGVVDAILRWRPGFARSPHRAVILCGPGNNGGDGYVIARLLAERGWQVEVFGMGERAGMPPDARTNRERWEAMGQVTPLCAAALRGAARAELYVDAVFGTGLTRPPEGEVAEALAFLGGAGAAIGSRLVAVDAPSGMNLDTGLWLDGASDCHPASALTVTFQWPKLGHYLADGPDGCGRLEVVDLGIGAWLSRADLPPDSLRGATLTGPSPALRKRGGHKYDHGHVLVVSGPSARTGAARLAARAALRVGAGLVTVASPPSALQENACQLTAIMVRRMERAVGLQALLEDPRLNAVCMGPGLGIGEGTRALVSAALEGGERAVILDADALTSFEEDPAALFAMTPGAAGPRAVLTPHAGEFRRLFPDIHARWTEGPVPERLTKIDAVREAARRAGAIVLLKGPDTVIAAPDGEAVVNGAVYDRAVPWLATAGAGDVLAGMIAGLAGRMDVAKAAESAAWLHVECARAFGPGLIAEDLPEMIPQVLRSMDGR